MERKVLTIYDLEDLNYAAEYIISTAQFKFYEFDEDGNDIAFGMRPEEHYARLQEWIEESKNHYLCFRYNEELHQIGFYDALDMTLSEVKEKYLKDYLKKLRNILRKDPAWMNGVVVSANVPDSYLDDLLALRWLENLKLWAIQWDKSRERGEEKKATEGEEQAAETEVKRADNRVRCVDIAGMVGCALGLEHIECFQFHL